MKMILLLVLILSAALSAFAQDSTSAVALKEVTVHYDKSNYHRLSNYSHWLLNLNRWTISESSTTKSSAINQTLFCTLENAATPIYIRKITFKAPQIDTITHSVNCVLIQNGKILFFAPLFNSGHSREAVVFDENATRIQKGDFYIGVLVKKKCPTCYFSQKIIPNRSKGNYITFIKEGQKKIDSSELVPLDVGVQYKIDYTL